MIPQWFLYIGGFSMLILGALQIYTRPRETGASAYKRFVNLGTLWSLLCISVGVGLLLIALGYWEGPLGAKQPADAPKLKRRHTR